MAYISQRIQGGRDISWYARVRVRLISFTGGRACSCGDRESHEEGNSSWWVSVYGRGPSGGAHHVLRGGADILIWFKIFIDCFGVAELFEEKNNCTCSRELLVGPRLVM